MIAVVPEPAPFPRVALEPNVNLWKELETKTSPQLSEVHSHLTLFFTHIHSSQRTAVNGHIFLHWILWDTLYFVRG